MIFVVLACWSKAKLIYPTGCLVSFVYSGRAKNISLPGYSLMQSAHEPAVDTGIRRSPRPQGERLMHNSVAPRGGVVNVRLDVIASAAIAVGTLIAERPPHRTVRAAFPHTAPTLGA
jgi:hypothetical protein